MRKTLVDVQLALANRISVLRCLQRIVISEDFRLIFNSSSDDERSLVVSLIEKADKKSVEDWLKSQALIQAEFDDLPIRDLRTLAHQMGIPSYSQLPKHLLISQIRARKHARNIIPNRTPSSANEGINS